LAGDIGAARDAIEAGRRLPGALVDQLRTTGCFGMTLPKSMGGGELDPVAQFEVCEAAARLDASVGWCVMIGSDAGYYSAWLDDSATARLWPGPDAVTAGWLVPAGQARETDDGYVVNGRWQFGSGCTHADVIAGGCLIIDSDGQMKPSIHPDQPAEWRVVLMPAAEVTVQDTWITTGLSGSGSHDYIADNVLVPTEHTFDLLARPKRAGPLYAFNYMFFSNLAAVPIGAAQAAIDNFVELATTKLVMPAFIVMREETRAQQAVADAEALVGSGRAWAIDVIGEIWETLIAGDLPDDQLRARFRLSAMHACRSARQAVERLYDAAGSSAIYASNPLDRAMRDQLTISAHIIASTRNLEPAGRVRLGLPANAPLF
jgi:alkylation response protein AidB-like acyl-CoA dehydrogenase